MALGNSICLNGPLLGPDRALPRLRVCKSEYFELRIVYDDGFYALPLGPQADKVKR